MITLCLSHRKNEECGFKKYIKAVSKNKNKIKHHQMKNWLMKCIKIFLIFFYFIYLFFFGSPFHIKFLNLLHGFFGQSHV